tara:strand:+ start:1783 stop:2337 length:555 start_codon:yes stop_codon:yes gene_type:complete
MITIPLKILLVEDHPFDADMISFHIQQIVENPEIRIVSTLEKVKDQLHNFYPDVILSDYNLPTCTGLDVLKLCKEISYSIPFIFITGSLQNEELAANTILNGTSGFILKKDMDSLQDKLRPLLKKIIFNMDTKYEIHDRIRKNQIAVNQIYNYIDTINLENKDHNKTIEEIKRSMDNIDEANNL